MQKKMPIKKILLVLLLSLAVSIKFNPEKADATKCVCNFINRLTNAPQSECTDYVDTDPTCQERHDALYGEEFVTELSCAPAADCGAATPGATDVNSLNPNNPDAVPAPAPAPNKLDNLMNDLSARKPLLEINIPGLNFSNVASSTDDSGTYLYIAWIPELISALYKFGIAIVSIVAVVVIIIQGLRIVTSGGGEAKASAYKKILQSVIGLVIAWGSFAILYNINPALVQFNALKVQVVKGIPLDTFDNKSTGYEGQQAVSSPELDKLFAAYAGCYGYDPSILKAIASVESGIKPYANPGEEYQGLFQENQAYCVNGINSGQYPSSLNFDCVKSRIDPETNTAAAAATLYQNLVIGKPNDKPPKPSILSKCPDASTQDIISLLYVAHNNGPGVMYYLLNNKTCTAASIRPGVRSFYTENGTPLGERTTSCDTRNKGALTKYAGVYGHVLDGNTKAYPANTGCVTADWGEGKYDHGLGAVKLAGTSPVFPLAAHPADICPAKTGVRVLKQNVSPTGRKILAVGDSLTADTHSHAVQLQQLTGIPMENVAISGQRTHCMYDGHENSGTTCTPDKGIKNRPLKSEGFTDLLILGGVNDIQLGLPSSTIESNLKQIYQKAKDEGLRVIALTITPFKAYGAWTSAKHDTLMTINDWIRSGGEGKIDIVIDAYNIIVDPTDPQQIDHSRFGTNPIHFNPAGHAAIAAEEKAKAF